MWEHFAHAADIGIRGHGAKRDEAFADVARALTAVVTDLDTVVARLSVPMRKVVRLEPMFGVKG